MKNKSLVQFLCLPLLRYAVAVCFVFGAKQAQALDVKERQIQIETRIVEVTNNYLTDVKVNLNFGTKYPNFAAPLTSQFTPIAVMPEYDVSRLIELIEKGGQTHVITAPVVTAAPNQTGTISIEGGLKLHVVPVVNEDGSISMDIRPKKTLVEPGSTLLIGRTIPNQNRDELVFLQPHLISGLAPMRSGQPVEAPLKPAFVRARFNWTGFYVGAQVGYARSQSDYRVKLGGEWEMFPNEAEDIENESQHEFDEDGYGVGGCAGFNYEFPNHLVIGVGIAGRKYWNLSNTFETGDFPSGKSDFDVWSSFNTSGLVTFGPKIGYAVGRVLPYISGGLAFGEVEASQKIFSSNFGGFREGGKESENRLGWNLCTGVQYAFTHNWSVRVEYSYSDLGTFKYPGRSEPNSFRDFTTWHMTTLTEHGGNFGIVYTFGATSSASPH